MQVQTQTIDADTMQCAPEEENDEVESEETTNQIGTNSTNTDKLSMPSVVAFLVVGALIPPGYPGYSGCPGCPGCPGSQELGMLTAHVGIVSLTCF